MRVRGQGRMVKRRQHDGKGDGCVSFVFCLPSFLSGGQHVGFVHLRWICISAERPEKGFAPL